MYKYTRNTKPSHMAAVWLLHTFRGVVVPERAGVPFRQIFLSRNGAPANIVYHRWNADTAAFRQISSGRGPIY